MLQPAQAAPATISNQDNSIVEAIVLRDKDKIKTIPVIAKFNTCPYVEWYKFGKCEVTTCKNHTTKTKTSCLALDRQAPTGNKIISDAEIHLFKFAEDNVSTRLVALKRKRAVTRVKSVLILKSYIEYLEQKYSKTETWKRYKSELTVRYEARYPLKIKKLRFQNWMWPYFISKTEYKAFTSKNGGECLEIDLQVLLELTSRKIEALRSSIKTGFVVRTG